MAILISLSALPTPFRSMGKAEQVSAKSSAQQQIKKTVAHTENTLAKQTDTVNKVTLTASGFDPLKPATWPKCAANEIVRADNGRCAKKPVQAPVAAQTAPSVSRPTAYTGDCNQWRSVLARYSWNVDVAVNVCNAESRGNPNNDNPGDYHATCYGSRGLFQIGCDSTGGISYASMFDPYVNIARAYTLYSTRGWQPWGATTCAYKVACY